MKKLSSILLFVLLTLFSFSQEGSNDPTFNPGTGFGGLVYSTAIQSDGKIIVGGYFTSFNGTTRNYIARLNTDGSLDASFNPGTGFNADVWSTSIQSDGKIIVGGRFTSFNGTTRNYIARLNTDGSLDTSFNPTGTGLSDPVHSTAIQSDGKIIVGGLFASFNGTARNGIARLNANGSLDTSFNPGTGFDHQVLSTSIQSDGKIIVGGLFASFNGTARNGILRLNANGSLDTSFNPVTGNTVVHSTSIQSDGKIIVGGYLTSFNGTTRNHIARLNANGSLDASFNPGTGFNDRIHSTSIQSDGKIITGGVFTSFNGTTINRIARLNTDGSLDASFNSATGFDNIVYSTSIQSDGKIIVGGQFTSFNGTTRNHIARLWNCLSPATGTDLISHCGPYTWINGIEYTENTSATFTISNGAANSCDSIVTLNLTINNGTHNVVTQTACKSYIWNGTAYTTSGTKLYNYINENGCPSTDTLHLTINSVNATVSVSGSTLTANLSGGNYQWIDCDDNNAPIAGETTQTFLSPQNGNYAVIVSNGTCQDTSVCVLVNSIGLTSLNPNEWKIYPNPTTGVFTISANKLLDNALVEIHSTDGKLIYSTVFSGTEMSFNIGSNPPGVYILKVDNKGIFRLIKN